MSHTCKARPRPRLFSCLGAWSTSLDTSLRSTVKAGALIGRGSGEAFQLALEGRGFVLVQASEGAVRAVQQG